MSLLLICHDCVVLLSIIVLVVGRLGIQGALTVYLGTAFFCLRFLFNYSRLGLGPITFTEWVFYAVIWISIILASISWLLRAMGKQDDESVIEFYRRFGHRHGDFAWATGHRLTDLPVVRPIRFEPNDVSYFWGELPADPSHLRYDVHIVFKFKS